MKLLGLAPAYVRWHYGRAIKNIGLISGNLIWFLWHFFSIPVLARTLFAPWERIHEERARGLDIGSWFETTTINLVMRLLGVCIRLTIIIFGLVFIAIAAAGTILFFLLWIFLPLIFVYIVVLGIILIVKPA
jgi:hypothetical protein